MVYLQSALVDLLVDSLIRKIVAVEPAGNDMSGAASSSAHLNRAPQVTFFTLHGCGFSDARLMS